eukprot:UN13103
MCRIDNFLQHIHSQFHVVSKNTTHSLQSLPHSSHDRHIIAI